MAESLTKVDRVRPVGRTSKRASVVYDRGDVSMQYTGNGSLRAQPDVGHSVLHVFYADGEKVGAAVVRAALDDLGAKIKSFDDVRDCLDSLRTGECHLVISNAREPAVEGLALLSEAKRLVPPIPVIVMVDRGDVQTAVRAMKGGAVECLERPLAKKQLLSAIDSAIQGSRPCVVSRGVSLSDREEQVLQLVLRGLTTVETARRLNLSRRTVEVHRSHLMRKIGAGSMVDLVHRCAQLHLLNDWP